MKIKNNFPRLTIAQVRQLSDENSFERGTDYFHAGKITAPTLIGLKLCARCHGSQFEPYQVSVVFGKKGLESYDCSCPRGGFCKHVVALLLNYVFKPKSIHVLVPLETALEPFSKKELEALVSEMVEQEPELIHLVELSSARLAGRVDEAAYRSLASGTCSQDSSSAIERGLKTLSDMADRLAKSRDWLAAGTAYCIFLDEVLSHYGEEMMGFDEEGDIAILVDELAEGLGKCLGNEAPDQKDRRKWIQTLLNAVLADVNLGGIDLAPSAEEAVLKYATPQERKWIEEKVRNEMERSSGWEKESLQGFLERMQKRRQPQRR